MRCTNLNEKCENDECDQNLSDATIEIKQVKIFLLSYAIKGTVYIKRCECGARYHYDESIEHMKLI